MDFSHGSAVKILLHSNAEDTGSIPGLGRFPGGGNGNSLQYSCRESPMDRGTWQATVHGVTKSWTPPSDWAQSIYLNATFSVRPTFSLPRCVHKSVLYICVSIPSLQIGSSVPFFSRFHIYVLIHNICFSLSDLLHSVQQTLYSSTLLQMTQSCSFYGWVIFHCIYVSQLLLCVLRTL